MALPLTALRWERDPMWVASRRARGAQPAPWLSRPRRAARHDVSRFPTALPRHDSAVRARPNVGRVPPSPRRAACALAKPLTATTRQEVSQFTARRETRVLLMETRSTAADSIVVIPTGESATQCGSRPPSPRRAACAPAKAAHGDHATGGLAVHDTLRDSSWRCAARIVCPGAAGHVDCHRRCSRSRHVQ
jgi:hypothetical protein